MEVSIVIDKLAEFFDSFGYLVVFLGSLIEVTPLGWSVPGGLILALAGFFAKTEAALSLPLIILAGSAGVWVSLILAYLLGKKTGTWLIKKLKQERNAGFAKSLLKEHGGSILTTSMMANLTRFWVAYVAGKEKYSRRKFLFYSFMSSVGWTSLITILGYFAGYERENIEKLARNIGIIGWLLLGTALFVIVRSIKKEYIHFKQDNPKNEIG